MASLKKKPAAKASKSVKKTVAKKPVAKKAAPKKPAAKKPVVKKPVTKKAAPSKTATKKTPAKKTVAKKPAKTSVKAKGVPEQMLDVALKVLDDRQAIDVVTVPLAGRSAIADYMIIASGRAGRQVVALAEHLREAFFKMGVRAVRVEGQNDANWVLVDAGDVIIHLFLPDVRQYYDLDSLWAKKPSRK